MLPTTFDELVAWIKANVPEDNLKDVVFPHPLTEEDFKKAAMWFCAVMMAEEERDSNSLKDDARLILSGRDPLDETDCTEWLQLTYYGMENGVRVEIYENCSDALLRDLNRHFGTEVKP
jgi:hypothetical protein